MFFPASTLWNILGVVTALLAITYAYFKWCFQYWKNRNVPHFEPTIPFGNLGNPLKEPMDENIAKMYKTAKAKGWKYCGLYMSLSPNLLVLNLEMIKNILTRDFQHFMDRGTFTNEKNDPFSTHLFALTGQRWRNLRAKLTPTFTSGKLKAMFQTLVDCGMVLEDYIESNITPTEPVDIKEIMVPSDGNTLTMNEVIAQSFVFFIAGFETSSTTMTFALFELAVHQDIQDKLRDEINQVLARHDNKLTYDSLSEMKYMGQVINETLRIHSPVRALRRICVKDYKVPGEDLIIEKGTKLTIPIRGLHYDEEYWENPKEFNPDRFCDERKKNMNQFTHLPFGQGPRVCIGERFGLMQVRVGLTCLLRKFRVKLDKKTILPLKMTVKAVVSSAEGGIWLNLEKV